VATLDARRRTVRLAHPIYGDVVRQRMSVLRARQLRRELADAVAATGGRRRDDALKIATWRLDTGDVDAELFVRAAAEARRRHDPELAQRLAEAAHDAAPTLATLLELGLNLHILGRHEEAITLLDSSAVAPADDAGRAALALLRAQVRHRGLGQGDEVEELLQDALAATAEPAARASIGGNLATIAALRGRAAAARILAMSVLDAHPDDPDAMAALTLADTAAGRPAAAIERVQRSLAANPELDGVNVRGKARVMAVVDAGGIEAAASEAADGLEAALRAGDLRRRSWWTYTLGWVAAAQGRFGPARQFLDEAAALYRATGERHGQRWALGCGLLVAAQGRDVARGERLAEALDELAPHAATVYEVHGRRGRAWLDAARGHVAVARARLLDLGDELVAAGAAGFAVRALADVARLGDPAEAGQRLAALAPGLDGELLPVLVRLVHAWAAGDAEALSSVSESLARLGALVEAGEAAAAARDAFTRSRDQRRANASARRAAELAAATEGVATPGLLVVDVPVPLSRREREIATLVAEGRTSKEVADGLYLSVRTVESHLARVYDKLGVRSRSELGPALGLVAS
jgi:DNA-binding CsgD family transcriptional regulator/tetratricopeptide (TPR) repeat protein